MGDQFIGFEPTVPDGFRMPPGYRLEGVSYDTGNDRMGVYYCWTRRADEESGDYVKDKRTACRQAWRAYNMGKFGPRRKYGKWPDMEWQIIGP